MEEIKVACEEGNIERVRELIGSYDPETNQSVTHVPEVIAMTHGHFAIAQLFIDHHKIDKVAIGYTLQIAQLLGQEKMAGHLATIEPEKPQITTEDLNDCLRVHDFQQYEPSYVSINIGRDAHVLVVGNKYPQTIPEFVLSSRGVRVPVRFTTGNLTLA